MKKEMNKNELITITATSAECSREDVQKIIDAFLDAIIRELRIRNRVELRTDFGSFVVRKKGGGPAPPGQRCTKIQRVVSFKATPTLKRTLRESDREFLERLRKEGADLQIEQLRKKTDDSEA